MQVLVMRFDYKTSAAVENLQKQAAAAGRIGKQPPPPHITLLAFRQTRPLDLKAAVEGMKPQQAIPLAFGSLGFFKQNGTFYAAPAVTSPLLDFHASLHLSTREFESASSLYAPGSWVPHATLANNIAPPFWGPMFARLSMEFEPFSGTAAAIECWSVIGDRITIEWSLFL